MGELVGAGAADAEGGVGSCGKMLGNGQWRNILRNSNVEIQARKKRCAGIYTE